MNQTTFNALATRKDIGQSMLTLAPWSHVGGWLPMTDATEHIYGSSGRGHPRAKMILHLLYTAGVIKRRVKGRNTYYSVPSELEAFCRAHESFDAYSFAMELKFMDDGSRPRPVGSILEKSAA